MANTRPQFIWRSVPSTGEILFEIHRFLDGIDQSHQARMALPGSMTGPKGAVLRNIMADGQIFDSSDPYPSTRMCSWVPHVTRKSAKMYLITTGVVARYLASIVEKGLMVPHRLFGYQWTSNRLTKGMAQEALIDISLTLKLQPYVFGVVPDTEGRVLVPAMFTLKLDVVSNIFDFLNEKPDSVRTNTLPTGRAVDLPTLIHKLSVSSQCNVKPRAVLVTEHRNLKEIFAILSHQDAETFAGTFIVMVRPSAVVPAAY
jgi:hypothetical protein